MASQTINWQDVCRLATLLREHGDRVLSGYSKLRLTPALLGKLNAAFESISVIGSRNEFQVASAHASQPLTISQLQTLHDFVQKTVGLTIAGGASHGDLDFSNVLDLNRFHSLRHLELRSCVAGSIVGGADTGYGVKGLEALRSQLEVLVLMRISYTDDLLWDVLSAGAVAIGPEVIWKSLSQLVVSYCGLRSLGRGLSLVSNLQWLDVSHNMLADAEAVGCCLAALPGLRYLNLSFNRLTCIPVPSFGPSSSAPSHLQYLLLSHNYIETLEGLEYLSGLVELNLAVNQLRDHSTLQPLRGLYQLQQLKVDGNPICFHKRHRMLTAVYLPPRAVFVKHRYRRDNVDSNPFLLDGQKLNEAEQQAVRLRLSDSSSSNKNDYVSLTIQETEEAPSMPSNSFQEKNPKRNRKVRRVVIADLDEIEEPAESSNIVNQTAGSIESSGEHLRTKQQLESVRAHFGQDKWLLDGGAAVQELLGLQRPASSMPPSSLTNCISIARPLSSSTPRDTPRATPSATPKSTPHTGHVDVQVLESLVLDMKPVSLSVSESKISKSFSTPHTTQSSQYLTANESDTVLQVSVDNSNGSMNATSIVQTLEDTVEGEDEYDEVNDADDDDDDDDEDEIEEEGLDSGGADSSKYVVQHIGPGHKAPQDVFLIVTSRYIKEVELSTGSSKQRWLLNTLQSSVLLSSNPCHVHLTFNTIVPSKRERIYCMDLDEAQKLLLPSLKAILEVRSLSAMNVAAFRCMNCSGEFSAELNTRKASKKCPTCGSVLVVELDEAPLPSLGPGPLSQKKSKVPNPVASVPSEPSEQPMQLPHSASDSSIGSAASLESPGSTVQPSSDFTTSMNTTLRRCESDIDIISNPSQSSIEVLDDVSRSNGTPGRKRSSEERQVVAIPSLVTVPEVSSTLASVPAGLTESSSSGSLTDSVCTAYDNFAGGSVGVPARRGAQGLAGTVLREESVSSEQENAGSPLQPTSLSNVLDGLLQTMSSKITASESLEKRANSSRTKDPNKVNYDYTDLSSVDHRLKLHLHLSVLDADEREVLQLLLRGEVFTHSPEARYPGLLVISSQKVYLIKITGPEVGDCVDRWVSRVLAIPRGKLQAATCLCWGFGFRLTLQGTALSPVMFILRDQQHTQNFFSFLKQLPQEPSWHMETLPSEKQTSYVSAFLQRVAGEALASDSEVSIKEAVLLSGFLVEQDEDKNSYPGGILLVTLTGLVLMSDELAWLMSLETQSTLPMPKCISKQPMSNLIQLEASGPELTLIFLDEAAGGEEKWQLTLVSDDVLEQIVAAIRTPWEELFSVPLQVTRV